MFPRPGPIGAYRPADRQLGLLTCFLREGWILSWNEYSIYVLDCLSEVLQLLVVLCKWVQHLRPRLSLPGARSPLLMKLMRFYLTDCNNYWQYSVNRVQHLCIRLAQFPPPVPWYKDIWYSCWLCECWSYVNGNVLLICDWLFCVNVMMVECWW